MANVVEEVIIEDDEDDDVEIIDVRFNDEKQLYKSDTNPKQSAPQTIKGYTKPSYSYCQLVTRALTLCPNKRATALKICELIANKHPYFKHHTGFWQSSIYSALTKRKKFFVTVGTTEGGEYIWSLNPAFEKYMIEKWAPKHTRKNYSTKYISPYPSKSSSENSTQCAVDISATNLKSHQNEAIESITNDYSSSLNPVITSFETLQASNYENVGFEKVVPLNPSTNIFESLEIETDPLCTDIVNDCGQQSTLADTDPFPTEINRHAESNLNPWEPEINVSEETLKNDKTVTNHRPNRSKSPDDFSIANLDAGNTVCLDQEEIRYRVAFYKAHPTIQKFRLHCTVCDVHLGTSGIVAKRNIRLHGSLGVLTCNACYQKTKNNLQSSSQHCQWCCKEDKVFIGCTVCPSKFCEACLERNFGKVWCSRIFHTQNWRCILCDFNQIWPHRAIAYFLLRHYRNLKKKKSEQNKRNLQLGIEFFDEDLSTCCNPGCKVSFNECQSIPPDILASTDLSVCQDSPFLSSAPRSNQVRKDPNFGPETVGSSIDSQQQLLVVEKKSPNCIYVQTPTNIPSLTVNTGTQYIHNVYPEKNYIVMDPSIESRTSAPVYIPSAFDASFERNISNLTILKNPISSRSYTVNSSVPHDTNSPRDSIEISYPAVSKVATSISDASKLIPNVVLFPDGEFVSNDNDCSSVSSGSPSNKKRSEEIDVPELIKDKISSSNNNKTPDSQFIKKLPVEQSNLNRSRKINALHEGAYLSQTMPCPSIMFKQNMFEGKSALNLPKETGITASISSCSQSTDNLVKKFSTNSVVIDSRTSISNNEATFQTQVKKVTAVSTLSAKERIERRPMPKSKKQSLLRAVLMNESIESMKRHLQFCEKPDTLQTTSLSEVCCTAADNRNSTTVHSSNTTSRISLPKDNLGQNVEEPILKSIIESATERLLKLQKNQFLMKDDVRSGSTSDKKVNKENVIIDLSDGSKNFNVQQNTNNIPKIKIKTLEELQEPKVSTENLVVTQQKESSCTSIQELPDSHLDANAKCLENSFIDVSELKAGIVDSSRTLVGTQKKLRELAKFISGSLSYKRRLAIDLIKRFQIILNTCRKKMDMIDKNINDKFGHLNLMQNMDMDSLLESIKIANGESLKKTFPKKKKKKTKHFKENKNCVKDELSKEFSKSYEIISSNQIPCEKLLHEDVDKNKTSFSEDRIHEKRKRDLVDFNPLGKKIILGTPEVTKEDLEQIPSSWDMLLKQESGSNSLLSRETESPMQKLIRQHKMMRNHNRKRNIWQAKSRKNWYLKKNKHIVYNSDGTAAYSLDGTPIYNKDGTIKKKRGRRKLMKAEDSNEVEYQTKKNTQSKHLRKPLRLSARMHPSTVAYTAQLSPVSTTNSEPPLIEDFPINFVIKPCHVVVHKLDPRIVHLLEKRVK